VSWHFVYEGDFVPENADARQKCSKLGHLARLFNAADAFSGATPPINRNVRIP
jgi:hypothetical protein